MFSLQGRVAGFAGYDHAPKLGVCEGEDADLSSSWNGLDDCSLMGLGSFAVWAVSPVYRQLQSHESSGFEERMEGTVCALFVLRFDGNVEHQE